MKKIALALACSLMAVSGVAVPAPALAQSCSKSDWVYSISGVSGVGTGYDLISFVELLTGASGLSLQQAVQWLGKNGYKVTVVSRNCNT